MKIKDKHVCRQHEVVDIQPSDWRICVMPPDTIARLAGEQHSASQTETCLSCRLLLAISCMFPLLLPVPNN